MQREHKKKIMQIVEFNEDFSVMDQDGTIPVDCNSITLINVGLTTVTINGALELVPGAQYVSDGNISEINKSRYQTSLNGGKLVIIRKNYLKF